MISNYAVSGMTCGRCAEHITEEVSTLPGVESVSVNHEDGSMTVTSEKRLPFDAITEAVAEAGDYSVAEA